MYDLKYSIETTVDTLKNTPDVNRNIHTLILRDLPLEWLKQAKLATTSYNNVAKASKTAAISF